MKRRIYRKTAASSALLSLGLSLSFETSQKTPDRVTHK
jgi:hypothetical protein